MYYYNSAYTTYNYAAGALGILVVAVVLTALLLVLVLPKQKDGHLPAFFQLLYDLFTPKALMIEKLLQVLYVFLNCLTVLFGIAIFFNGFFAGFGRIVLGLVILVGLFLLLLPTGGGEGEEAAAEPAQGTFDLEKTEARLAQTLSQIKGAGEVTVMLTVANGPRQVLAQDVDRNSQQGEESTQTVILSRGSSSQETVTVQEIYPRYQGALVVCPGGDDPEVRLQITEALSALTGLGADKISISEGK